MLLDFLLDCREGQEQEASYLSPGPARVTPSPFSDIKGPAGTDAADSIPAVAVVAVLEQGSVGRRSSSGRVPWRLMKVTCSRCITPRDREVKCCPG